LLLEFAAGMRLASLWHSHPKFFVQAFGVQFFLVLTSVCFIGLSSFYFPSHGTAGLTSFWRPLGWGVPAAVLVAVSLSWSSSHSGVSSILAWLGERSYSLYLSHSFCMVALAVCIKTIFSSVVLAWTGVFIFIVLAIALSACVFSFVEKPLLIAASKKR
jgi:exopolysaccharide production protein ExoZ